MTKYYTGRFYPPNPASQSWRAGKPVDSTDTPCIPNTGATGGISVTDVEGLQAALDSKSDVGHQHVITDVHPKPATTNDTFDGGTFF